MDDLISRADGRSVTAMRLIDADALKSDHGMKDDCADCDKELRGKSKACEFDRVYTKMDFCGWLDDAPTVDAVEVIRCKDCKNSKHWYRDRRRCFLWNEDGVSVFENGFCNYGERKERDGNG